MEDKYEEIRKIITTLYCENKSKKGDSCANRECSSRIAKCLCMDEEQITLLCYLAEFPFVLRMENNSYKFVGEEDFEDTFFCTEQVACNKRLVCCKKNAIDQLVKLIKSSGIDQKPAVISNIIKGIPIVQAVNMTYKINLRDSICCLCLFSDSGQEFFSGMLQEFIWRMGERYYHDGDVTDLKGVFEEIVSKIERILEKDNFVRFSERLLDVIEQYVEAFDKEEGSVSIFTYTLKEFADEVEERISRNRKCDRALSYIFYGDTGGEETAIHLFHIMEKILMLYDQKISDDCRQFFAKSHTFPQNDIYDPLEKRLDRLFDKEDKEERKKELKQLQSAMKVI